MAELRIREEPLPGVFVLDYQHFIDHRGDFSKLFHTNSLKAQGIHFELAESFLTRSRASVLRGMHFQIGEAAHKKIVTCIKGRVLDVIVDVRPKSNNFNKPFAIEISEGSRIALLIGKGYAHGFLALDTDNWMLYNTTAAHNKLLDRGVLWSSINFDWPSQNPTLSQRDENHPPIGDSECIY